ncbi:hypothetical protein CDD82_6754 [Ophiocordyceps australis]|uniref:Cytochrome-b5 reductase n=1 Tax=Ophiocordyceps australis TaxID=1399860 RepID=A0A2C5ZQB6_9HYPO|nr:hypothetical protein CDD82_6754 [Ophiocordyceps australis]
MAEHSVKEVSQHSTGDDAWMVIHGKVYDVTKYLHDHPGGPEVLAESAGTDASEAFDNVGHSEDAMEIMDKFCIGPLAGYKKKAAVKPPRVSTNLAKSASSTTKRQKQLPKFISVGIFSGTMYLVYRLCQRHYSSLPRLVKSQAAHVTGGSQGFGFFKGLLFGAGVFAIFDTAAVQAFIRKAIQAKSYTEYPAHIKLPRTVATNELLQRGWLDPVEYKPLPLSDKKMLSHDVCRLTFKLPSADTVIGLPIGQHVAIKASVDGETVSRSYTPTSNNSDKGILQLTIKMYANGKLTNGYLNKLAVGDEVLFRGPKGAMRYHRNLCANLGMICGGTGITPMFQLIRAICQDDRDVTNVSLIFANKTEEDILLRKQLDEFAKGYSNVSVYYLIDHPPADWKYGSGHVNQDLISQKIPGPDGDTKVLLCGPPGLVNASKKSLVNLGFKEPGASAKMDDEIFLF